MATSSLINSPSNSQHHLSLQLNFIPRKFNFNFNFKVFTCLSLPKNNQNVTHPTKPNNDLKIIFAAGGTGGHIFPAVAIADQLKNINPNIQILFLGTKNGMESTSIPSSGYDFIPIQAFPLLRPLFSPQNLIFPYYLIKSIIYSLKILSDFRPQVVVGTGGYVSAPVCLAAWVFKDVKMVIQEQNSTPGIANLVLSFFADMIFVAFPSSVKYFRNEKCIVSGNPIRLSMKRDVSKAIARLHFFPKARKIWDSESKVLLILGGSLGASSINLAILDMYSQMLAEHKKRYIIWQTGVKAFDEMESLVKNHSHLILTPFLHKMDLAYATADLVVSRAGAMTCSEILATGKPSILIPSPSAAEEHQMKNASIMSDIAGSLVITEEELDSTTLRAAIEYLLGDERRMTEMSKKAMMAARPDASFEIAQHILSLVESAATKRQ